MGWWDWRWMRREWEWDDIGVCECWGWNGEHVFCYFDDVFFLSLFFCVMVLVVCVMNLEEKKRKSDEGNGILDREVWVEQDL
jgi:hypothetical protein